MTPHEFLVGLPAIWLPAVLFASLILRYTLIAGGATALLALFRRRVDPVRLQKIPISGAQIRRELFWSVVSLMIFSVVLAGLIAVHQVWPIFKLYPEFGKHGLAWEFVALAILFFGHDAYFYAAHRLMHAPGVYERVHAVHHRSTNPTPLAAFSFHPLEAVVELAGVVLLICIVPVSATMVLIFTFISVVLNVIGHLGVEVYPRWWLTHPILGALNSATVHNHHHRTYRGNYGLYTLIWDRLFGTFKPPRTLQTRDAPSRSGFPAGR
ncbi:fatty acid hydroxylase family protein [Marinicauda algicola]|uniref:Fatty acid hydroxylase family protein n=1 Tax=Marinicauda algicola TaxID=2029849 RepID=A0A4S2H2D6_9PROT|nr:sterol desaturase family protein [Marinicauda algicola]TGY89332.1 fatty acid hydroxylase family protein [Marinicauda algicola]